MLWSFYVGKRYELHHAWVIIIEEATSSCKMMISFSNNQVVDYGYRSLDSDIQLFVLIQVLKAHNCRRFWKGSLDNTQFLMCLLVSHASGNWKCSECFYILKLHNMQLQDCTGSLGLLLLYETSILCE